MTTPAPVRKAAKRSATIPRDYSELRLSPIDAALAFAMFAASGAALMFIFYQNGLLALLGLLLGLAGPRYEHNRRIARRKRQLNEQFRDLLYSLSSSVSAGLALPNAMNAAYQDLQSLYFEPNTLILLEIRHMLHQIQSGQTVAESFQNLANRSHDEDILSFSNVLMSTQDSGVNLRQLIRRTAGVISEKIEVQQEILTNVASMKMEQKIMCGMPVMLMLFINLGAKDYMAPLYASPAGYLMVTGALALLAGAIVVSDRIMNIKV